LDDILSIKYRTIYAEFSKLNPRLSSTAGPLPTVPKGRRISAVGRFGQTHTDY
jgi:hypothetical protein